MGVWIVGAVWLVLVGCRPVTVSAAPGGAATEAEVRARVAAAVGEHRLVRLERREVGAYTLHVAHLEQGPVAEDQLERFSDARYVVVERAGALAELGVLAFVDASVTHFKRGADFSVVGVRGSTAGPLLLLERSSWWRGDPERTRAGHGTATHARVSLLVCRWTDTLVCADVPLAATEAAFMAEAEAGGAWGVRAELVDGAEEFVFTLREGDAAAADALGVPRGRVGVAELFARYPAGFVGQGL